MHRPSCKHDAGASADQGPRAHQNSRSPKPSTEILHNVYQQGDFCGGWAGIAGRGNLLEALSHRLLRNAEGDETEVDEPPYEEMETAVRWSHSSIAGNERFLFVEVVGKSFKLCRVTS